MAWRWVAVASALACAACSSTTTSGGSAGSGSGGDSGSNAAACNAPYGFPDASPGEVACTVKRAYVQCKQPSGETCACITDDPTQCAGCSASNGYSCTNLCASGSYGVSCGVVGPNGGTAQSLPSGCSNVGYTPAGIVFACCPCGTH